MPQNDPAKSYIFLSYHHDDNIIASAIQEALGHLAEKGRGRDSLSCFLDTHPDSISEGLRWEPIITAAVETTDWLVAIYTGDQSAYCGFETGTFSHMNNLPTDHPTPDKYLECLHDVKRDDLPLIFRPYQTRQLPNTREPPDNVTFWWNSSIGVFLRQFCSYHNLYAPADNPIGYTNDIAHAAHQITTSFDLSHEQDEKSETPCQLGLQIRIPPVTGELTQVPGDSLVIGTSLTFDILDLSLPLSLKRAPQLLWSDLRSMLRTPSHAVVPWMDKVEGDVLRASRNLVLRGDDITFIGSNGRVYRPILARHKLYYNGSRKFYLLFVETLDRRFVGRRQTSLLLAALIMASRLRFTYFENWNDTVDKKFGQNITLAEFGDSCKQLLYNIEWMENESVDYGLDDPDSLVQAFGSDKRARIERFYADWKNAKEELLPTISPLTAIVNIEERDRIRKIIIKFLESVKKQNAEFLELCVEAYGKEILSNIRK
jgi:hypothetical protein